MSLGTVLLLKIFPALLPPINEDDRGFYEVLGLSSQNASEHDIRKAYKSKSLALHPDKVAQRRESAITAEEAAKEYQLVQEAHTCLSDKASRQKYHAVKCSPTRYRFLTQGGGLSNQMGLLKNLSQASFADKTRLVLFVSTFPALMLVQPILIAVKVNQILQQDGALEEAPWTALLIPWWIVHGLFVAFWIVVSFMAPPEAKMPIIGTALEQLLWLIAFILLALRWDNTITADYALLFIPVCFALLLKWLHFVMVMEQISREMNKMVSKNHFLNVILHGREPEELEEEDLKELHDKYLVVHQIPADVEHDLENDEENKKLSDEEKEEIRVASSREFEAAMEAYGDARRGMIKSIIFDVSFLILLILKIDNHVNMSWWLVFLPILVSYGLRILRSCFVCCCSASPMDPDEVVVLAMKKGELDAENENENGNENSGDSEKEGGKQDSGGFALRSQVVLHGLKSGDFNGKTGVVKGPLKDGRQEVYIEELDKTVSLKAGNMTAKENTNPQPTGGTTNEESKTEEATSGGALQAKTEKVAAKGITAKDDAPQSTDDSGAGETPTRSDDDKKTTDGKDNDSDDEISIHIDEETYKAYQSAYAQAEANAMEDRVRAGQDNCAAIIQLIMVCLLVAKLEQSYDAVEKQENGDDDSDVGFNTLWLLFPLFLIVGFMISCCACLIYGAPDPDEMVHKEDGENEDADVEAHEGSNLPTGESPQTPTDAPIVFAPPPPPETTGVEKPISTESAGEPHSDAQLKEEAKEEADKKVAPPDVEGDINDLD